MFHDIDKNDQYMTVIENTSKFANNSISNINNISQLSNISNQHTIIQNTSNNSTKSLSNSQK